MDAMRLKLTEGFLSDAFLLKVFMGALLLICTLISFNLYAGDSCVDCGLSSTNIERAMVGGVGSLPGEISSRKQIKNDIRVCGALETNNFKKLKKNLKKYYQTTLKESNFDIEYMEGDLLHMVIEAPTDRYFMAIHLQRYFEKNEKAPKMFSKVLLHEIDGQNAIMRIEREIRILKGTSLDGTEYENKLIKLRKKYLAYLKKHPVSGSAEALNSQ